jgi:dihydroorotate dehydrogenase
MDPEGVHHLSFKLLKFSSILPGFGSLSRKRYKLQHPELERDLFGLKFPNPVGLAAGFDKDAKAFRELADLGFGFIEIGTITPKPQAGNPKTRLFRLPEDQAIINRMGFNNDGVEAAVERLKTGKQGRNFMLGGNIGKNKTTPNDQAVDDYLTCYEALYDHVDYFVVNVSSPNTPGLRSLQEKEPLKHILQTLLQAGEKKNVHRPLLLKIAPDLTNSQLDDVVEIVTETGIDGLIATNTTIERTNLTSDPQVTAEQGGLSGAPLTERATAVISYIHNKSNGSFPIIAVGGIMSAQDALDKLDAGADLVQLYTGFVYEGPRLVRDINEAILNQAG